MQLHQHYLLLCLFMSRSDAIMHGPVQGCAVNSGTGHAQKGPTARRGHPGCKEELTAQTPRGLVYPSAKGPLHRQTPVSIY